MYNDLPLDEWSILLIMILHDRVFEEFVGIILAQRYPFHNLIYWLSGLERTAIKGDVGGSSRRGNIVVCHSK